MKAFESSPPLFRLAKSADLDVLHALENSEQSYPWSYDILKGILDSARHRIGLYELGGRVIGYFAVLSVAKEYTLLNIVIAEKYRGNGYGRALLKKVITMAKEEADTIFLEVRASNFSAIDLYLSEGFVEIGQRRDYYPVKHGREDALILAMPLAIE